MAKIHQETIVITLSKLTRNSEGAMGIVTPELIVNLEALMSELLNDSTLVVEVDGDLDDSSAE